MTAKRSPESVLAGIPGWEGASFQKLDGGLSNCSYIVESRGKQAVLKIDAEPRSLPYNSREDEQRAQAAAAAQGLASRVLYSDECAFLSEYSQGSVWSPADLDDENNLEQLAYALKALHSLPLTGRMFDPVGAARAYVSKIGDRDTDTVRHCMDIVRSKGAPRNICCCHNDLVAGNIISTPALKFLDWEYACDNDPFFDLATVITHHQLSQAHAGLLLNAYFNGDGERWQSQLQYQMHLYDALHWLWLAGRSPAGANQEQLDQLAARLKDATERG